MHYLKFQALFFLKKLELSLKKKKSKCVNTNIRVCVISIWHYLWNWPSYIMELFTYNKIGKSNGVKFSPWVQLVQMTCIWQDRGRMVCLPSLSNVVSVVLQWAENRTHGGLNRHFCCEWLKLIRHIISTERIFMNVKLSLSVW